MSKIRYFIGDHKIYGDFNHMIYGNFDHKIYGDFDHKTLWRLCGDLDHKIYGDFTMDFVHKTFEDFL